ncbi:MAG: universal stress protein [Thermodesulfobacteriota bacterium]|nr:MAG: universal stress protein [Thermodesulfobacteriota bacterium]
MIRFKNILLVLHGKKNEEAIRRAFGLAKSNNAKLTIVDVLEELPDRIKDYLEIISAEELQEIVAQERTDEIQTLISSIETNKDFKPVVKTLVGKPHIEIIKEVLRNKHDLVMKTPEGKGDTKEALFGSIDINIMRKCPCPVWMIKPSGSTKYSRILAAVDPEPNDQNSNELNNNIMQLAVSIAELEKSELHVVHAWSLFGEKALRGSRFKKKENEINKLIKDAENHHRKLTEELLKEFSLSKIKHKIHLPKGNPGEVIPEVAKKEKIDLIVMGTVCRTGLPGFIIGNTAESILYKVDCSVLSIKPRGFISPITA